MNKEQLILASSQNDGFNLVGRNIKVKKKCTFFWMNYLII